MADRYIQITKDEEVKGRLECPVELRAYAILNDTAEQSIIAQLKLRNCAGKELTGAIVGLNAFDQDDRAAGEVRDSEFNFIQVAPGADFGTQTPIQLPDENARKLEIFVKKAVFSDGSVWEAEETCLEPMEELSALPDDWTKEITEEYETRTGGKAQYVPVNGKGGWICSCGAHNAGTEQCYACRADKRMVFSCFDRDLLEVSIKEKQNAKEVKTAARRKRIKLFAVIAGAAALIVAAGLTIKYFAIPYKHYRDAVALMEEEKYSEAIKAFEALDGFSHSKEQIEECKNRRTYKSAEEYEEKDNLAQAERIFRTIPDYKDSEKRADEIHERRNKNKYEEAEQLLKKGSPARARVLFKELAEEDYSDASKRVKEADEADKAKRYKQAKSEYKSGKYQKAYNLFKDLGGYKDASDKASQAYQKLQARKRNKELRETWSGPLYFDSDTGGYFTFEFIWPKNASQPTVSFSDEDGKHSLTIRSMSTTMMVLYDARGVTHTLTAQSSGSYNWSWNSSNGIYFH